MLDELFRRHEADIPTGGRAWRQILLWCIKLLGGAGTSAASRKLGADRFVFAHVFWFRGGEGAKRPLKGCLGLRKRLLPLRLNGQITSGNHLGRFLDQSRPKAAIFADEGPDDMAKLKVRCLGFSSHPGGSGGVRFINRALNSLVLEAQHGKLFVLG